MALTQIADQPGQVDPPRFAPAQTPPQFPRLGQEVVHLLQIPLHALRQFPPGGIGGQHRQGQAQAGEGGAQVMGDPRQEQGAIGQQLPDLLAHVVELTRQAGQFPGPRLRQGLGREALGDGLRRRGQPFQGLGHAARQEGGGADDQDEGDEDHQGQALEGPALHPFPGKADPPGLVPARQAHPQPALAVPPTAAGGDRAPRPLGQGQVQALQVGEVEVTQTLGVLAWWEQPQAVLPGHVGPIFPLSVRVQVDQGFGGQHHQGRQVPGPPVRHRHQGELDHGGEGQEGEEPEGDDQGEQGPAEQGEAHQSAAGLPGRIWGVKR